MVKRFLNQLVSLTLTVVIITLLLSGMLYGDVQKGQSVQSLSFTADHSKFPVLQKKFKSAPEVTQACLTCHTEAAKQIMETIHWKWVSPESGNELLGKKKGLNNFCISIQSNEPRCTSCHAGYGWKDKSFDFSNEKNVDCLVCHDNTGTYKKFPTAAGHPAYKDKMFLGKLFKAVDLNKVAQGVGLPKRNNCGACHFFGGGGDNVKHGDLSSAMANPDKSLDVHMDANGLNFACQDCHTTHGHNIAGRSYDIPAVPVGEKFHLPLNENSKIMCESCHTDKPHKTIAKLNDHTDKVACQTCHIPTFAKVKATKMKWDWSKAGKMDENGKPLVIKDEHGHLKYHAKKGEFVYESNVKPEYYWFNGKIENYVLGDKIDPSKVVKINRLEGSYDDPNSKIWPFKVHRGRQAYDVENNILIIPKLFGKKGSGAFWAEFNWDKAFRKGMEYVGVDYSGKFDWVDTEMYWVISHQVAPKEQALQCSECHSKNGRLQNLAGFYMPGRDSSSLIDKLGLIAIIAAFAGVLFHSLGRIFARKNR